MSFVVPNVAILQNCSSAQAWKKILQSARSADPLAWNVWFPRQTYQNSSQLIRHAAGREPPVAEVPRPVKVHRVHKISFRNINGDGILCVSGLGLGPMTAIVKLHDVRVSYQVRGKPFDVLLIPEWTLEQGQHVALVGPSGCGKTTLLHVLSGLFSPTCGNVEVCGNVLERMRESDRDRFRARHIGYIFQSFNLLQGYTAVENVLLGITFSGRNFGREHAISLLERVGLVDRMDHYPSQLSIGEQQRVAVARSLANRPELILADEPTGSLDPANSNAVADLIREVCHEEKRTLVLVSHEREVVDRFEQVISFLEINHAFAEARANR